MDAIAGIVERTGERMSEVLIRQLQRNIETLELLESEYAKRIKPRARLLSIRSALNNAIIALRKTKASYEEATKEQKSCQWCKSEYTIINDDYGQPKMVKYCFNCGRKVEVSE